MEEMSFEYWNKLADQVILISSLLSGFSIAVVANFLVADSNNNRLKRTIMKTAVLAAGFFLVSLFAMTKILMMTTNGFPLKVTNGDLKFPSIIGGVALVFGIMSLITMISLSGWTKSKKLGRFTVGVGVLTFLLILIMLT
ncbi:hypothetical protein [Psychroflexus montanilacus]|uniref:hypothetical protein n=1 Tax=Psychroflexus montanilacus TaxID=2873598 RepID=UPI001CCBC6AF|nr:hypothetical protein [Psychroflexus montanilacus]MBZ9651595.1 hypothetical protein [Psychroflexus montanilacus]